ncbi:MAG: hypothetical protein EPN88_13860 [Bacteroidetes bacterium]|nr:MAG: hypothetical protein EPN88_13860 [Bacteroidota bacterium]
MTLKSLMVKEIQEDKKESILNTIIDSGNLSHLIDTFGEADLVLKEAKKDRELAKMNLGIEKSGTYEGSKFSLNVSESAYLTLNPSKVLKKIGAEKFMKICKVTIENAKEYLSNQDLDECTESDPRVNLVFKVKRNKKGGSK